MDRAEGEGVEQVDVGCVVKLLFSGGTLAFEFGLVLAQFDAAFVDIADKFLVGLVDQFEAANRTLAFELGCGDLAVDGGDALFAVPVRGVAEFADAGVELTSRWSTPVTTQNHVLSQPRVEDGKLVFWVENQAVWLWATNPDGDDPPVYDRENADGAAWPPTGAPLSTFLLHVTVFEAIMGCPRGGCASWVSPVQWEEILAPLRPLPMPDWRWPAAGHRLYAADGLLAFGGPNPGPGEAAETAAMREVWVAADTPERLEYLAAIKSVEWDWLNT